MKFAFEEFHLWYQFALSLMAAGKVSPLRGAHFYTLGLSAFAPKGSHTTSQESKPAVRIYPLVLCK